jgi:hypothetical protein
MRWPWHVSGRGEEICVTPRFSRRGALHAPADVRGRFRAHTMPPLQTCGGLNDPPVPTTPWGKGVPGQDAPKKSATPRPGRGALHAPFPLPIPLPSLRPTRAHAVRPYGGGMDNGQPASVGASAAHPDKTRGHSPHEIPTKRRATVPVACGAGDRDDRPCRGNDG